MDGLLYLLDQAGLALSHANQQIAALEAALEAAREEVASLRNSPE